MDEANRDLLLIGGEASEIRFGANDGEGATIDFRAVADVGEALAHRCFSHSGSRRARSAQISSTICSSAIFASSKVRPSRIGGSPAAPSITRS